MPDIAIRALKASPDILGALSEILIETVASGARVSTCWQCDCTTSSPGLCNATRSFEPDRAGIGRAFLGQRTFADRRYSGRG